MRGLSKGTTAHWINSILGSYVGVVEFDIGGRREIATRCSENGCVVLDGV